MAKKKAAMILAGKTFANCFNQQSVETLKKAVFEELSARDTAVTHLVVLLAKKRFAAAELFLNAGFNIIPADDENLQVALECAAAVNEPVPPDEIVFSFGDHIPERILQYLAGKTCRTLLRKEGLVEESLVHLENYIDISNLLFEDTVDTIKTPVITVPVGPVPVEVLPDVLPPDDSPWHVKLEDYVRRNDGKIPAAKVFSLLKEEFPFLWDYYENDREELIARLPASVLWIVENEIPMIYDKRHHELKTVSAAEAQNILTFGNFDGNEDLESQTLLGRIPAYDFEQISVQSKIMKQQCNWSADRIQLSNTGADYHEVILPRDQELENLGKEYSIFLWPIRQQLSEEEYRVMAECYTCLEETFAFLHRVQASGSASIGSKYLQPAAQLAAMSQCLIKSALQAYGLGLSIDNIQRDSFQLLVRFAKENHLYLSNLRLGDKIDVEQYHEIMQSIRDLRSKFELEKKSAKTMKNAEGQLEYHLKKIAQNPSDSSHDWTRVVEAVTILHEDFRVPVSSVLFRKYLIDYIDKIPEDIEITDCFGDVVQQIDLFREQQFEFGEDDEDKEDIRRTVSPALQKVRNRYGGTKVVFIGGTPQDHLKERLEKKLDVTLLWSETRHSTSIARFSPLLNDDEVSLFLVYIPWCSHAHSEELMQMVRDSNKEFVRLRKGTNPEQIAAAICSQIRELSD